MRYTENYNLKKPEPTDSYNIDDFNENSENIDKELAKLAKLLKYEDISDNFISSCDDAITVQSATVLKRENEIRGTLLILLNGGQTGQYNISINKDYKAMIEIPSVYATNGRDMMPASVNALFVNSRLQITVVNAEATVAIISFNYIMMR